MRHDKYCIYLRICGLCSENSSKNERNGTKRQKKKEQPQLFFLNIGAGNEVRTRDPNHGKVMLYQLSYSRIRCETL